jgi:hypothetical protein
MHTRCTSSLWLTVASCGRCNTAGGALSGPSTTWTQGNQLPKKYELHYIGQQKERAMQASSGGTRHRRCHWCIKSSELENLATVDGCCGTHLEASATARPLCLPSAHVAMRLYYHARFLERRLVRRPITDRTTRAAGIFKRALG